MQAFCRLRRMRFTRAYLARRPGPRTRGAAGRRPRVVVVAAGRGKRARPATRQAEARSGDGRRRLREERLDRARREGRARKAWRPRRQRSGSSRRARRGSSGGRGSARRCPKRARLRSLRTDGEVWFASFSRSTLGPGSAETKRTRLWQIAATLAPHGDEELAAIAAEGRLVTTLRLGVRPGSWRAETGENDYPYVIRGLQLRLAALGYLDRSDVTGSPTTSPSRRSLRSRAGRSWTAPGR